jgi:hypothetical protein
LTVQGQPADLHLSRPVVHLPRHQLLPDLHRLLRLPHSSHRVGVLQLPRGPAAHATQEACEDAGGGGPRAHRHAAHPAPVPLHQDGAGAPVPRLPCHLDQDAVCAQLHADPRRVVPARRPAHRVRDAGASSVPGDRRPRHPAVSGAWCEVACVGTEGEVWVWMHMADS